MTCTAAYSCICACIKLVCRKFDAITVCDARMFFVCCCPVNPAPRCLVVLRTKSGWLWRMCSAGRCPAEWSGAALAALLLHVALLPIPSRSNASSWLSTGGRLEVRTCFRFRGTAACSETNCRCFYLLPLKSICSQVPPLPLHLRVFQG